MVWRHLHSKTVSRYTVVFGCFLLNLPLGIPLYFGNLISYTNSYFLFSVGPGAFNVDSSWILPLVFVFIVCGNLSVDLIKTVFSLRRISLISIVIFDAGLFLTYFTVQHSVGLVISTFVLLSAYGNGIIGVTTLQYTSKVMPERMGLGIGIVSSAYGFGAVLMNFMITEHINPENLSTDWRARNSAYFSQSNLLENVPSVFIILGLTAFGFNVIGYILQQIPFFFLTDLDNFEETIDLVDSVETTAIILHSKHDRSQAKVGSKQKETSSSDTDKSGDHIQDRKQKLNSELGEEVEMEPSEVLRSLSFYRIFFHGLILSYCYLFSSMYYKLFGQLWIRDDTFLTTVGSFAAVNTSIFRVMIGFFADFWGLKNTFIFVMGVNSILTPLWYIAPQINRWLFFLCHQVLYGFQGSIYTIFPLAAMKLYGTKYYASNYGLIMLSVLVNSLLSPMLFAYLKDNYGLYGIVFIGSMASVVSFLTIILAMSPANRG